MSTLLLVATATGIQEPAALAAGCPNEQLRARQVQALELPDCRAYEQVSPVDKNGADAVGGTGAVETSPTGGSVSFGSEAPFPQATGSFGGSPLYLGVRSVSPEGWSTFGLTPPHEPTPVNSGRGASYVSGWTEDLTRTVVVSEEVLAPGATPEQPNAYVRDNSTGAYQLLAPAPLGANVYFADAPPGGAHIIFETAEGLSVTAGPKPAPGVTNLYEWNEAEAPGERVSVVGVLPSSEGGEAPAGGSHAGGAGSTNKASTQNTISQDGSRVFFTDAGTGRIYMRLPHAEPPVTIPISQGAASWQTATPGGSFVFYTEGPELYRFNVDGFEKSAKPQPQALLEAREQITSGAEGPGTFGVSDDGAYAYFVAPGVLASNKREYENPKGETVVEEAVQGASNLYQWHEEASPIFIAGLGSRVGQGFSGGTRVTPDGKTLLFGASVPLTGYPTVPECEAALAPPCWQFFRYTAASGRLSCVSCNPTATITTREPDLSKPNQAVVSTPQPVVDQFVARNLSEDGTRVFFETSEALLPQDGNNQPDVYEWEAEGAGSCTSASTTFDPASGGCFYLISTGQNHLQSYFGDASADGSSVFFFTQQSLIGQDQDANSDLYDAQINGGIPSQNPLPPPSCTGDACRGAAETPPVFGAPASGSLSGAGNLVPPSSSSSAPPKNCVKGKRLSHGKCVRPRKKCAKGKRLRHGKCVKARTGKRSTARKAGGERRGGQS